MSELRILVVEDERPLLNMVADSLSRSGQIWRAISSSPHNQFDEPFVVRATTISQAQSLIDQYAKFHLFILDISVKNEPNSTVQGDGLSLIPYAITAKKKPSAVVSLTGTSMDGGRDVIKDFYDGSSYACLSKYYKDDQRTINGFVEFLTTNVTVDGSTMPKILSLCSSQAYLIMAFEMKRDRLVIKLRHSEDSQIFTITHRRTCLFLHRLGWISSDRTISESEIAELFDGIQLKNVTGEISKIREQIKTALSPIGSIDKAFIDRYLFTAIRGTQGFQLVASVKIGRIEQVGSTISLVSD